MSSKKQPEAVSADRLQAVASAVYVAVTGDLDHPDGGDNTVSTVTDSASLKAYVESYLDGYEVSAESLGAAEAEGFNLTADTLEELISQASAVGLDRASFFEDGEFDIEGGVTAAASFDPDAAPAQLSVREQVLAEFRRIEDEGGWLFIDPSRTYGSIRAVDAAFGRIQARGLPRDTSYIGWGGDRDHLRPDGGFKRGEDSQEVFWWGDHAEVAALLRRVEPLGFTVEGGENGTRFRLVAKDDASSTEPFALPLRSDLLSDQPGASTDGYRYASSYVEKTHRPKSDDDYLTPEEAQALYDGEAADDFYVLPDVDEGELPAWSMKVRPKKKAVVTHYHHPSGSVARIIELEFSPMYTNSNPRGSLRRTKAIDYAWPADHVKYTTKTKADEILTLPGLGGTREIVRHIPATGEKTVTKHRNDTSGDGWRTYPLFGEWTPLLDPRFGEPDDPTEIPQQLIDRRWADQRQEFWGEG